MKILLKTLLLSFLISFYLYAGENQPTDTLNYKIVDTGVTVFYDNTSIISTPGKGQRAIDPFIDTHYFKQPLGDSG